MMKNDLIQKTSSLLIILLSIFIFNCGSVGPEYMGINVEYDLYAIPIDGGEAKYVMEGWDVEYLGDSIFVRHDERWIRFYNMQGTEVHNIKSEIKMWD